MMLSLHSIICVSTSFFLLPNSIVWIYVLLIRSSVDGHLGIHLLAVTYDAAVNIHAQAFVWPRVFISFGYRPKTGIAELFPTFERIMLLWNPFYPWLI